MLRGGIAERGGVRVGHRIIEINNQSVVAVPHEKIVNLLATSVGEVSKIVISRFIFMFIGTFMNKLIEHQLVNLTRHCATLQKHTQRNMYYEK